jgi:L-ascorbate metabolism protein UlaG (beta-lactamase superfamily)
MTSYNLETIHWLGHSSFRIDSNTAVIYLDPWQLGQDPPLADLILITHDHRDHCSPEDVARIQGEQTLIITVQESAAKLQGNIEIVKPGYYLTRNGVDITVVPAYNLTKFRSPGVPFHPKGARYAGFILAVDGQRIYHAGDTDVIPEMAGFEVDIALLPVSGTYVMTADEALEAAGIINPKVIVPMHIGRGIGSQVNVEAFKAKSPLPVEILEIYASS